MDEEDPAPVAESAVGDLPATESTAVFKPPPPAGSNTVATVVSAKPPGDESEAKTLASAAPAQFTVVVEHELDQMPESDDGRPATFSPQTAILVVALVAIGLTIWFFLRPPSADALYERIMAVAEAGERPSPDDVEEFMVRYGDDSRAKSLRRFEKEIELERLQRKFDRRVKGLGGEKALLPIERAYLEALNYAWLDPARGARKMKALIELYGHESDDSGPTGQCLELARRRLAQLEEELNSTTVDHLALIASRLDEAEKLRESNPEKAKSMFEAVIELYAEKPWAADAVRRARKDLGELGWHALRYEGRGRMTVDFHHAFRLGLRACHPNIVEYPTGTQL